MRLIGYTRSSDAREQEESHASQETTIRAWARAHGHRPPSPRFLVNPLHPVTEPTEPTELVGGRGSVGSVGSVTGGDTSGSPR